MSTIENVTTAGAAELELHDPVLTPPPATPTDAKSAGRWGKWLRLLRTFLIGQMALQLVNAVAGILLLRWLNKTSYAQFSMAFGFQSTVTQLTDLGFSNSIIALVGERGDDPAVVGGYIRAAWRLRIRMFALMSVATVIAFPIIIRNQPWSASEKALLLGSILLTLFAQGWQMYQAALVIRGRLDKLYLPQVGAGLWRVVGGAIFYHLRLLTGWVASWISCAAAVFIALSIWQSGRKLVEEPGRNNPAAEKEMVQYLLPLLPGLLFTAFQGQLSLFLITYFGRGNSIADVAALARLGQLFTLLGAFNGVAIEPYIARVSPANLPRRYIQILLIALGVSAVISVFAVLFPGVLLWILGPKYANVRPLIPLLVLSSCAGYVAGVIWCMNAGRRWIFWWYTYLLIAMIFIAQVFCVLRFDLGSTRGVLLFNLVTSVVTVAAHLCGGVYGLIKRRTPPERE